MSERRKNMSKTCTALRKTLAWANALQELPITHLGEDRIPFAVARRSYLEFGLYTGSPPIDLRLGPHRVILHPGTLVVLNAHFGYTGTPADDRPLSLWWLSFDVSGSSPFPGIADAPLLELAPIHNAARLIEQYQAAFRLRRGQQPFQPIRLKCGVLSLLADLHEAVTGDDEKTARSPGIQDALRRLYAAYTRADLSRSELAEAAHLSEAQFGRLFRREMRTSPMQYVGRLRLARARELLDRSRLNITEVARAAGFCDPFHFSRVFKREFGVSPRNYRAEHMEE